MGLNEAQKKERSEFLERYLEITECSQRKPYVFVSYASDNWETVFKTAVVPMQRQYGLRVYADKAFDKVNDKWIVPMLRNIRGADVVVAFVSQSYIESYACFLELLTAVNNRKQIVFVSLEDQLRLGDTTDQPVVERGAKNEILNQGANISTNTNNTSNDIMRAMKSAYTSISTLLEQDALSKYDISDAFINFFRDASINRKTINDLDAVRRTIKSVSRSVFDPSLVKDAPQKSAPRPAPKREPEPVYTPEPVRAAEPAPAPEPVRAAAPAYTPEPAPVRTAEPARQADFFFSDQEDGKKKAKKPMGKGKLIGGIAGGVVALFLLLAMLGGGTKSVTDEPYTAAIKNGTTQISGLYTGKWDKKNQRPVETGVFVVDKDSNSLGGATYEGEWADGLFEGQGTMTWPDRWDYEGEWKAGNPSLGKMTYASGDIYDGERANFDRNGRGKMIYANEHVYEGEWKDGQKEGQGVYTWPDGEVYDGEWKSDQREGQGKAVYANGDTYEGEWKAGNWNGHGVRTWANGDVYEGPYVEGRANGEGVITYADGTVKSGEWVDGNLIQTIRWTAGGYSGTYTGVLTDGKPNGMGTMKYDNGNVYVGEWVYGIREGQGREDYPDGGYYEGEWKNNRGNGQATRQFAPAEGADKGDLYVGGFVDGKFEGYGVYTWARREDTSNSNLMYAVSFEGEWVNGSRNGPGKLTYDNGSFYEGTFVDGKKDGAGVWTKADGTKVNELWDHGTKIE